MYIEIDQSVFRNPEDTITKLLIYIHSMETFIPEALNLASSAQNRTYVDSLGPFALAFGCILDKSEVNRKDKIKGQFNLYKGI